MGPDTNHLTKDIVQNLIKAKKTLRMYPENNPIYIKTVDAAFAIVQEYLDFHDELALKIRQFEVICDGEQVYHNPGKDDNFALFFFKDGVRDLIFRQGLVREELEDFLRIIAFDFDSVTDDDDVVTMMWERDFQHIGYVVDETYLMDDEDYEGTAVKEIKEKSGGEDEILRAYREAFDVEGVGDMPVIPLGEDDIVALRKELDADISDSGRKLRHMLLEMFYMADTRDELQELSALCKSAIDFSLQYVDVDGVCTFVQRADALSKSERCPETIKPYFRLVVGYINSDRVIKLVGDLLDSGAEVEAEKFDRLFTLMDTTAIPSLIRILGELSSIHARKAIINSLIILGKRDLASIAKGLVDSRWYVVRNLIYVFREIGDKRAVEYLVKKLRHEDIRVRKEIIKALGELGGGEVVQHLRGFIDSPDSALRTLAAKA
ncbi:MAG: HEAT repeat domain-containing protein, partial [Thermodesulfovibrionales bacterium]